MPQVVKKRRSVWAVLAICALVASILAVGASPAAASPRQPDQEATWKACLGPAMAERGFTDVSATDNASHYDNINCLAYYGITTGRTADTYAPGSNVTRSQMALFLNRAADVAGIDLGDAEDQGFTDLNADDTERFDAINRLVGAGIMFGDTVTSFDPPSTTIFAPTDYVARWEMAMFLFAFLDHALTSVLIDELPNSVEGNRDGTGHVELNSSDGEVGQAPDDYFRDARRQTPAHVNDRISAIYELGITTGANGMIGEQGVFNPNGLVTRAQMASFIMRTMGHTNLRPAGLTAQSTDDDTQVSVRDADFVPIGDMRTEVFTTNFPDDAFNANGGCNTRFVREQDPSFDECEIDRGDTLTDGDDGNAIWRVGLKRGNQLTITCTAMGSGYDQYQFMAGTRGSDTAYTIYAWSSSVGDRANVDAVFESVPANVLTKVTPAVKYIVTGEGSGYEAVAADAPDAAPVPGVINPGLHFRMGETVTFTVQLLDKDGDPVGPTPGVNYYFDVKEDTYLENADAPPQPTTETPAPDGFVGELIDSSSYLVGGVTGLVYEGPPLGTEIPGYPLRPKAPTATMPRSIDPRGLHARDNVVDTVAVFDIAEIGGDGDFTRIRYLREPDSGGQLTVTVGHPDPVRLRNNPDALVRVTITPAAGNTLTAREDTKPRGHAVLIEGNGVQLPDVRFSDNASIATKVKVDAEAYRIRALRNRNSISASVLDQYGALYRAGDYVIEATDEDHDGLGLVDEAVVPDPAEGNDFPDLFRVSSSGRRSLGYTHTGTSPERQDVYFDLELAELRIPLRLSTREIPAVDNRSTPYINEAFIARVDDPATEDGVDESTMRDDPTTPYVNEQSISAGTDDENTPFVNEALFGALVAAVSEDDATEENPESPPRLGEIMLPDSVAITEDQIGISDDPLTEGVNEAVYGIRDDPLTTGFDEGTAMMLILPAREILDVEKPATIFWADVARGVSMGRNAAGDPVVIGDPSANYLVVDELAAPGDEMLNPLATPVAYLYGLDDNFVVEGAAVTMDQFEEVLAQYDPSGTSGGLIKSLGLLTWSGYDFSRPRDGATWTIDHLDCREPPKGD